MPVALTDEEYAKLTGGKSPLPGAAETAEAINTNDDIEDADAQRNLNWNRKRTGDAYQDLDLSLARKLDNAYAAHFQTTLSNASTIAQNIAQQAGVASQNIQASVLKVSDMAADGMWTDQMNPVTRGAGADLTGQAPVDAALASTASLTTVFDNLTTQFISAMNTQAASFMSAMNNLTATVAAQYALIAQLITNSGNAGAAGAAANPNAPKA
jgi:hypothetical protein